jgi:hypothetical protein
MVLLCVCVYERERGEETAREGEETDRHREKGTKDRD